MLTCPHKVPAAAPALMLPFPVCPPRLQLVLVYCEALIIISYFYMIPQRLGCEFLSPQLQRRCGNPPIPLFAWWMDSRCTCCCCNSVSYEITFNGMLFVCSFDVLGIHGNPLRSLPLFTVYLATLVHTYRQGELDNYSDGSGGKWMAGGCWCPEFLH